MVEIFFEHPDGNLIKFEAENEKALDEKINKYLKEEFPED